MLYRGFVTEQRRRELLVQIVIDLWLCHDVSLFAFSRLNRMSSSSQDGSLWTSSSSYTSGRQPGSLRRAVFLDDSRVV